MATTKIYRTEFCITKLNAVPSRGGAPAYQYRRDVRTALVSAASDAGVLSVLNSDVSVSGGEVIEILSSKQIAEGTEPLVLA
jgi:hypothetical protein